MPTIRRSRILNASPEEIWATASNPHHLPRWWPLVQRVEGVDADGFTQVLRTQKGRGIRADFRIEESRAPEICRWEQEVQGTPFERLVSAAWTQIRLEPTPDGRTVVTIEVFRKMRGLNRLGGFMLRRATRGNADDALDGLERLYPPDR